MDLRTGCSLWPQLDGPLAVYAPLCHDLTCDIAIIGGGISGALAAYYFTEAGIDTIVIDRRELAMGSTVACTGLIQYEIDTSLCELIELLGRDHATRAYLASYRATLAFAELVKDLPDDAALVKKRSLYLATEPQDVPKLKQEFEARREIEIPLEFFAQSDIEARFSFSRPAALYSSVAFEVDPYRLTHSLLARSVSRGLRAFSKTELLRYTAEGNGILLETDTRHTIRAKKILFATGYETPSFLNVDTKLLSTYAAASQPLGSFEGWHDRCLIWETARPYFYARTSPDGRALVGGLDIDSADPKVRDALIPEKSRALAKRFNEMFPKIEMAPLCSWAGTFAQTPDGLPYIGPHPDFPQAYFALGYGGNGITFSLLAAQILRDAFLQKPNEEAALFRFDRLEK